MTHYDKIYRSTNDGVVCAKNSGEDEMDPRQLNSVSGD